MAISLTGTRRACKFAKILVYGKSGAGKTRLIATAPKPIIISIEGGLLSLADLDIPVIEIECAEDIYEAYNIVTSKKGKAYETVCIDSISDIAETLLSDLKKKYKDKRKAYGDMADECANIIRLFRDIKDKHIYATAKLKRVQAEDGGEMYYPSMPGNQMMQNIPYYFDEVLALRLIEDDDNKTRRWLQTQSDQYYDAKDRSGKLKQFEVPNLTKIIRKMTTTKESEE